MNTFLHKVLTYQTVDALHFWWPSLIISTNDSEYDDVVIRIEGTYIITNMDGERMVHCEDVKRLEHLCTLARQTIAFARIVRDNDLLIQFTSGMTLQVIGDNGSFEGWHVEAKTDEQFQLLVAGVGKELTFFDE